jgi:GrpB-like predicted nucleotidyltransferase (UPF0157 family)
MGKYVFLPYSPEWPRLARKEIWRISKSLGELAKIEHVGSTAVPGLGGKGIIDLAVVVSDITEAIKSLEPFGYVHKAHADDPGKRWFLMRGPDARGQAYHVHLMDTCRGELAEMVAFRDYLRVHPDMAQLYVRAKLAAVAVAGRVSGREAKKSAYMAKKEAIIFKILKAVQD